MQVDLVKAWRALQKSQEQRQLLKGLVPSRVGLQNVSLERVSGAGNSQKVAFRNIDQALEDPSNQNITRLKDVLLHWCRRFGEARMEQGSDPKTFVVIVTKAVAEAVKAPAPELNRYEPFSTRKASIISRAVIGKK